jgi:hypothetical protein
MVTVGGAGIARRGSGCGFAEDPRVSTAAEAHAAKVLLQRPSRNRIRHLQQSAGAAAFAWMRIGGRTSRPRVWGAVTIVLLRHEGMSVNCRDAGLPLPPLQTSPCPAHSPPLLTAGSFPSSLRSPCWPIGSRSLLSLSVAGHVCSRAHHAGRAQSRRPGKGQNGRRDLPRSRG